LQERDSTGIKTWDDLIKIKGIGAKTIQKCKDFAAKEDPYDIHKLERQIATLKAMLPSMGIPMPTHTSDQVPFSEGVDTPVVWVGLLMYRNQKNLFEAHFSRTGEELDPATVKDVHLAEWVSGMGSDTKDVVTISWDRWKYPRFKNQIFDIKLGYDLVVVQGVKKGYQAQRSIKVHKMWVFDPEER